MGFKWCGAGAVLGLLASLLVVSPRPAKAQGGPPDTFTVPSLQAIGKAPDLEGPLKEFRSGDIGGALQLLRAAAKKNPDLPPPQVILAAWLAEVNQPAMARNALETAVLEVPDDPEAYLILADLAARERRLAESSLLLAKAHELLPGLKLSAKRVPVLKRRILTGLVAIADSRRNWGEAQKHLEALLADDPNNAAALEQLGRTLFQLKKTDEALAKLQQAAKLDKTMLAPEATIAQLYQQSGDTQNAHKWIVAAIQSKTESKPDQARIRRVAAQWALEVAAQRPSDAARFLDQAEEQAKAAVQLDPDSAASHTVRGLVAMARKDYRTAEEFLQKAHLLAPGNFSALSNLAVALAEQKSPAKGRLALEYAQVLSRLFPDQPEAGGPVGWVLYKAGRLEEAESALRRAASVSTVSPDTLYFYARVLADGGRKDEAKKVVDAAMTVSTRSSAPFIRREEAEALMGELKK